MGKPRLIILVRHAQSEGNQNREIHQYIPDHRVELTDEGKLQAQVAGLRLKEILEPGDSLRFLTSPYRRTRDTTAGMLETLTEEGSHFKRENIIVHEEPRIREQDFGNFQPCSTEMSRMWQERAAYGHFFYRISNGESAADAYDRVSSFNESLWRQFKEDDFPSVCVLVTHGLMTRIFLMKWYHWTVEEFEDLRNINHCEFIVMRLDPVTDKYKLDNKMRKWSDLQTTVPPIGKVEEQTEWRWGGCAGGCAHKDLRRTRHNRLKQLADEEDAQSIREQSLSRPNNQEQSNQRRNSVRSTSTDQAIQSLRIGSDEDDNCSSHSDLSRNHSHDNSTPVDPPSSSYSHSIQPKIAHDIHPYGGRDFGGSLSGAATPDVTPTLVSRNGPLDAEANGNRNPNGKEYGPRIIKSSFSMNSDGSKVEDVSSSVQDSTLGVERQSAASVRPDDIGTTMDRPRNDRGRHRPIPISSLGLTHGLSLADLVGLSGMNSPARAELLGDKPSEDDSD